MKKHYFVDIFHNGFKKENKIQLHAISKQKAGK